MKRLNDGRPMPSADNCESTSSEPRSIRRRLSRWMARRIGPDAGWVRWHVANCPRCRNRMVALGRADLALSAIRSQSHRLDLLMRANAEAVRMLNHQLRAAARARGLEESKPEPSRTQRCSRHMHILANVAACVAILALTKTGLFSSLNKAHTQGQKVMQQYYANHAGEDLAGEVFQTEA